MGTKHSSSQRHLSKCFLPTDGSSYLGSGGACHCCPNYLSLLMQDKSSHNKRTRCCCANETLLTTTGSGSNWHVLGLSVNHQSINQSQYIIEHHLCYRILCSAGCRSLYIPQTPCSMDFPRESPGTTIHVLYSCPMV